ncbi:tribbles homolog 3-like [Ischnura elegans]|uniref:tribbles homolog 3-like n=1 Tax=Ischnura elegans TaxID=197161 RepID=UPI001ED8A455|nr:tribbles homolog 3-like [Ischnura elegans]
MAESLLQCTLSAAAVMPAPRKSTARTNSSTVASSSPSSRHYHPYKQRIPASSRTGVSTCLLEGGARGEGGQEPVQPHLATPALVGGKYLLQGLVEGSALYRCVDVQTREEYIAKVLCAEAGRAMLSAHLRMRGHPHVAPVREAVWAPDRRLVCLLLPPAPHGHLHSHVRSKRRLRESEARRLFRQMAAAVRDCHARGLVLRDLKLRKFVFADAHRTHLRLESLEDAVVVGSDTVGAGFGDEAFADYSPAFPSSYAAPGRGSWEQEDDDRLLEKRGCPAYVPPEVLRSGEKYSGRAADMWSLGVVLYTMLVGRYPFSGGEHASLFARISRGRFGLPEALSARARCLVRSLLRREPGERPSAADVLLHPWLAATLAGRARDEDCDAADEEVVRSTPRSKQQGSDQAVPGADCSP